MDLSYDMNRSSEETAMVNTIKVMQQHIKEAKDAAYKWGITFEVKIVPEQKFSISVVAQRGGHAYVKIIPFSDVQYFSDDTEALVSEIVEQTFTNLIKDLLKEELRPSLTRAMANCVKMASR